MPAPPKKPEPKDEHPVASSDGDIEYVEFGPKTRALLAEFERRAEKVARKVVQEELAAVKEIAEAERDSSEFKLKKALRGDGQ